MANKFFGVNELIDIQLTQHPEGGEYWIVEMLVQSASRKNEEKICVIFDEETIAQIHTSILRQKKLIHK